MDVVIPCLVIPIIPFFVYANASDGRDPATRAGVNASSGGGLSFRLSFHFLTNRRLAAGCLHEISVTVVRLIVDLLRSLLCVVSQLVCIRIRPATLHLKHETGIFKNRNIATNFRVCMDDTLGKSIPSSDCILIDTSAERASVRCDARAVSLMY